MKNEFFSLFFGFLIIMWIPLCSCANSDSSMLKDKNIVKGFDVSYVDYFTQDKNFTYKDIDGKTKDIFQILKNHGINTVRLRLWVNPTNTNVTEIDKNDGDCTLERTIRSAKKAKNAGFKILLDFHYSDYWADPGKQLIPESWQNIETADKMAQKIGEYTKSVLLEMKKQDVLPNYVQIGNEIDSGLLLHTSFKGGKLISANQNIQGTISDNPNSNFAKYLVSGAKAAKEVSPEIKVVFHITNSWNGTTQKLIDALKQNENSYDIIALSYYPWEQSHRTITDLKSNIALIKQNGKNALIAETSMPYQYEENDNWKEKLSAVAVHLINPKTGKIYSDLECSKIDGTEIVKASVQNQKKVIMHIFEEAKDSGAIGLCVWGGDLRGNWTWSFFDENGKALESIKAFEK